MSITTIYFVRHGEAVGNRDRIFHGYYDSQLTPDGREQAKRTAEEMQKYDIDVIISSDLTRAYDTAAYIADGRGLDIITTPALREINGGGWENVPWDQLHSRYPQEMDDWLNNMHVLQMPGGESSIAFWERLVNEIELITEKYEGKKICIVTHGTAIKTLMCYFDGVPLNEFTSRRWHDNCSITIVEKENGKYKTILDGYNGHLGELSTLEKQDWWK